MKYIYRIGIGIVILSILLYNYFSSTDVYTSLVWMSLSMLVLIKLIYIIVYWIYSKGKDDNRYKDGEEHDKN